MSSSVICFLSRITQGTSFAGTIQLDRIISCSRKKHKNLKGAEGIKLQRKSASFLCGAITDPFFCHSKHARACPSMLRYTREYPRKPEHTREGNTKPNQSKPIQSKTNPIQTKDNSAERRISPLQRRHKAAEEHVFLQFLPDAREYAVSTLRL